MQTVGKDRLRQRHHASPVKAFNDGDTVLLTAVLLIGQCFGNMDVNPGVVRLRQSHRPLEEFIRNRERGVQTN